MAEIREENAKRLGKRIAAATASFARLPANQPDTLVFIFPLLFSQIVLLRRNKITRDQRRFFGAEASCLFAPTNAVALEQL